MEITREKHDMFISGDFLLTDKILNFTIVLYDKRTIV